MTKLTDLINKMTLEEKAALCTGASPWTTTPIDHLGLPEMTVADGPHGVRRVADVNDFNRRKPARHLLPNRLLFSCHLGCGFDPPDGAGYRRGVHRLER